MMEQLRLELTNQWQSSLLLRSGAWLITIILLLYAVLWLDDALSLQQVEWRRAARNVTDLERLQQREFWNRQLAAVEEQRAGLLAQTLTAETAGLAQAQFREILSRSIDDASVPLTIRRTEFAEPQPVANTLSEMRGRLTVDSDGQTVPWDWIAALETHQPAVILDALSINVGSRKGLAITLEFRALVSAPGDAPR